MFSTAENNISRKEMMTCLQEKRKEWQFRIQNTYFIPIAGSKMNYLNECAHYNRRYCHTSKTYKRKLLGIYYAKIKIHNKEFGDSSLTKNLFRLTIIGVLTLCLLISFGAVSAQTSNEVTKITRITGPGDGEDQHPAWSPNGSKIIFQHSDDAIVIVNPDGTGRTLLIDEDDLVGNYVTIACPKWSFYHDNWILFRSYSVNFKVWDIMGWTIGGRYPPNAVAGTGTDNDIYCDIGPSGIYFISTHGFASGYAIYLNDYSNRLTDAFQGLYYLDVSPDGSKIVFSAEEDIWIVNSNGSGLKKLTSYRGIDTQPAWSPDGSLIAYTTQSRTTPWNEIWVMNADGSKPHVLIDEKVMGAEGHCSDPAWSPDGSKIAFVWEDAETHEKDIYVAEVNLGVAPTTSRSGYIVASQGGMVVFEDVKVQIPADALSRNTMVTVTETSASPPSGYVLVSSVYDMGPDGTTFSKPVVIIISYNEAGLPIDFDENKLAIYVKRDGDWQMLESDVDAEHNRVSANVGHFSQYAVLAETGGETGLESIEDILGIFGYVGPVPVLVLIIIIVVGIVASKAKK